MKLSFSVGLTACFVAAAQVAAAQSTVLTASPTSSTTVDPVAATGRLIIYTSSTAAPAPSPVASNQPAQNLWVDLPAMLDLALGDVGDSAFAAVVCAIINVKDEHIPQRLFGYSPGNDYITPDIAYTGQNTDGEYDGTSLWKRATISADGKIAVGMWFKDSYGGGSWNWTAQKVATIAGADGTDVSTQGRLWVSVLQQTFKSLWNPDSIAPNSDVTETMFQYRLNWMTALTGWNTMAKSYTNCKQGHYDLFIDLAKCNKVPCTIVTNGNTGGLLPAHTDLTVLRQYGLESCANITTTKFEVYEPFSRIHYNTSAYTILQQIQYLITPYEGNLPLQFHPDSGLGPAQSPKSVSDLNAALRN